MVNQRSYLGIASADQNSAERGELALEDTVIDPEPISSTARTTSVEKPISGKHESALSRGDALGRYVVLALLGRGGMGEVYAAYDPELDRRVAVKIIHAEMRTTEAPEKSRARLVREAQTLAKLAHPNIVAVYDVGEWSGDVFVAMEFIEGLELGAWLKTEPRDPSEVLDIFIGVAEGLRAAHLVGLAHRDVKPENILIGNDGRPRLIDFGIARATAADGANELPAREIPDAIAAELGSSREVSASLETRTGALIGTPAYMAPEQFLGGAPDARSDQFSFCVALWEALAQERPFTGNNVADLSSAVLDGERNPLPSSIPTHVGRGLIRGLANQPGDRWAQMGELIDAIKPPDHRGRNLAIASGLAAMVAAAAAVTIFSLGDNKVANACTDVGNEARLVWSSERRSNAEAAFLATGDANASEVWARVADNLDQYERQWRDARQSVCEASVVRREQSAELAEKRVACLQTRLGELRAVATLVEAAGPEFVENAVETVGGLGHVADCENMTRLSSAPEIPDAVASALAETQALGRSRKLDEGEAAARRSLALATRLDSRAGVARSWHELGVVLGRKRKIEPALDALFTAVRLADEAKDTRAEAEAWIEIVRNVGWRQQRFAEAERWMALGLSAIRQDGSDLALEARLRYYTGWTERTRGDHVAGLASFQAALKLYQAAGRAASVEALRAKAGIAASLRALERHHEAVALGRDVLAGRQMLFGPGDPQMASSHSSLATSLTEKREYEEAREHYKRAIALRVERSGENDPGLAWTVRDAGLLEQKAGDLDAAAELFARALKLRRKGSGENHPRTLQARARLGYLAALRGELPTAIAVHREVTSGMRALGADAKYELGKILAALCRLQRRAGAMGRAGEACAEAVEILSGDPPDPRDLATALTAAARVALANDDSDRGDLLAEQALQIRRDHLSSAGALVETLLTVALSRLENRETRRSVGVLLEEIESLEPKLHRSEVALAVDIAALRSRFMLKQR